MVSDSEVAREDSPLSKLGLDHHPLRWRSRWANCHIQCLAEVEEALYLVSRSNHGTEADPSLGVVAVVVCQAAFRMVLHSRTALKIDLAAGQQAAHTQRTWTRRILTEDLLSSGTFQSAHCCTADCLDYRDIYYLIAFLPD